MHLSKNRVSVKVAKALKIYRKTRISGRIVLSFIAIALMLLPIISTSQFGSVQIGRSTAEANHSTTAQKLQAPSSQTSPKASQKTERKEAPSRFESLESRAATPPPPETNTTSSVITGTSPATPLSTPTNTSPAPGDPTNHWWDLWSYSSASEPFNGSFSAASNTIDGYSGGDEVLILPMNIALGSTTYLNWFQFDIEFYCSSNAFGCSNGVDWYIWNIVSPNGLSSCTPSESIFNDYDIASSPPGPGNGVVASSGGSGLSYNVGDVYDWSLYDSYGNAVFLITDVSNGNFWWVEFSVSSFNEVTNGACFSPVSGVEGYTSSSDSSFSQVNFFQFNVAENGAPPASEAFEGSGEPSGITTNAIQYDGSNSGGNWYWTISQTGSLPDGLITSFNAPSTIDIGQTADISFTATNVGAQAVTETMTMSFPGASASELSIVSSDLDSTNIISAGSEFPGCYTACIVTLSYPLVEGRSDNWNSGVTHSITIAFTPTAAGTYSLYYKTVATSGYADYPFEWSPDSSGTNVQDQQGEWVYVATIVVTVPISITLLNDFTSNPISGANYFTADYVSGGTHYTAYFTGSSTLTLHADGGTDVTISGESSGSDGSEEWCFTNSCGDITLHVDSSAISVTYYYFDLLTQRVSANVIGGSGTIPLFYVTAPPLLYVSDVPLSTQTSLTSTTQTLEILRGTVASVYACTPFSEVPVISGAPIIECDSDTWNILPGTQTSYTISKADQLPSSFTYYQQYEEKLSFSTSDGSIPPSSPTFASTQFGDPYSITLSMTTPVTVWLDADASYNITPNPLTGSTSTEQWIGSTVLLSSILFEPLMPFNVYAEYDHQFLVTFGETGLDSTAGTNAILTIQLSGSIISSQFTYSEFPVSDWIDAGSVVNYVYSSPVPTSNPETQFALQSISGAASPFTVTGTGSVTGNYLSQATAVATCAGTSPTDICTGTPSQDGSLTAISTATGVSVYITGTSATGTVTITTSNYGDSPPATGADISLGAAGYYDVEVNGAYDGIALVCITTPTIVGAVIVFTMQYWNGESWVPATNIEMIGNVICGDIPVSALVGTSIATGPPAGTAPCSSLTSSSDDCSGIPKDGTLTATSLDTNVVVTIEGTSATGSVTITIVNYGPIPPASGPDGTLTGANYYDVSVNGATDGDAAVCITNPLSTAMHYFTDGSWVSAAGISVEGSTICGNIPVSLLTGTPIAIGTLTPSSSVPEFPTVLGMFLIILMGLPLLLALRRRFS